MSSSNWAVPRRNAITHYPDFLDTLDEYETNNKLYLFSQIRYLLKSNWL